MLISDPGGFSLSNVLIFARHEVGTFQFVESATNRVPGAQLPHHRRLQHLHQIDERARHRLQSLQRRLQVFVVMFGGVIQLVLVVSAKVIGADENSHQLPVLLEIHRLMICSEERRSETKVNCHRYFVSTYIFCLFSIAFLSGWG